MDAMLRRYKVKPGALEQFVEEWKATVRPLRERFGFRIVGAWTVPETNEFVWVLDYSGPDGFETANERYYASPERKAIDPDPARHIESMDVTSMVYVLP